MGEGAESCSSRVDRERAQSQSSGFSCPGKVLACSSDHGLDISVVHRGNEGICEGTGESSRDCERGMSHRDLHRRNLATSEDSSSSPASVKAIPRFSSTRHQHPVPNYSPNSRISLLRTPVGVRRSCSSHLVPMFLGSAAHWEPRDPRISHAVPELSFLGSL